MRAIVSILCAAAACAAPFAASAQDELPNAPAADQAPSPEALSLISTEGVSDIFEALPSNGAILVRHAASGLVCRFDPGEDNQIHVFPGFARGEDVACDTVGPHGARTFYATRYPQQTSNDEQLSGAIAAIMARIPRLQPMESEFFVDASIDGVILPAQQSARFTFQATNGMRRYTRVSVAIVDGWVIKMRYTADAPDDAALSSEELLATMSWTSALAQMVQAHGI